MHTVYVFGYGTMRALAIMSQLLCEHPIRHCMTCASLRFMMLGSVWVTVCVWVTVSRPQVCLQQLWPCSRLWCCWRSWMPWRLQRGALGAQGPLGPCRGW